MCVPFRLPMCAFRFPCGFLSIAYAAPTWCPIMGSLCIPMDPFRNGMHFVSCVHVSVLSLSLSLSDSLSLSLSLYLYAFFVSALLAMPMSKDAVLICFVLPMSCIHLSFGVPVDCLNFSVEFPQGVLCDPYGSLWD